MESLVADNEALKRDVAELQNILAEAREDNLVLLGLQSSSYRSTLKSKSSVYERSRGLCLDS